VDDEALAVAVYVTKVPVPFMNKGQNRTADQDAAEARKNKDWDPNAPLYGKNPARPAPAASGAVTAPPVAAASAPKGAASAPKAAENKPAVTGGDPLGDLARAKAAAAPAPQVRPQRAPTRSCISSRPVPFARPRTQRPSAPSCR
jgi:hypothetical protein